MDRIAQEAHARQRFLKYYLGHGDSFWSRTMQTNFFLLLKAMERSCLYRKMMKMKASELLLTISLRAQGISFSKS